MVKIFKNCSSGGNGEFVIQTDVTTVGDFADQLARSIESLINDDVECMMPDGISEDIMMNMKFFGDVNWALTRIMESAFPIAFKLAGYKADVHESRVLTSGYSSPDQCDLWMTVEK